MKVTDAEIERAIRNRLNALDDLPVIVMPFDPEVEKSKSTDNNLMDIAV